MGTLYRYEMKKILCQKILWIAVLIMTLVILSSGLVDIIAGRTEISKSCKQFSGREIDNSMITEVQESENADSYIVFRNFINFCMGSAEHGTVNEEQVYSAREAQNANQMGQAGLTDAEKAYWQEKESSIKKPFTYQYEEGYAGIFSSVYVANFILLILSAIVVSGIFADEKINGTDQIIFSSVSREKLFGVKILAGGSVGMLLALYLFGIVSACSLGTYGISGFGAPLQIRIPGCMLPITIGEAYLYVLLLFTMAGIVYAACSMFFSQIFGSRTVATALMVIGLFLSMLNIPEKFGVLSEIWSYLPGAYIGSWTFTEYRLVSLFGKFYNNLQVAPVAWLTASVVLLLLARISYKHYQVRGK